MVNDPTATPIPPPTSTTTPIPPPPSPPLGSESPTPPTGTPVSVPPPAAAAASPVPPAPTTANPMNDGHNESRESTGAASSPIEGTDKAEAPANKKYPAVDRIRAAAADVAGAVGSGVSAMAQGAESAGRAFEDDPRVVKAWKDGEVMVAELERYAAQSHGLTQDVELIKKVAGHLKGMLGIPDADTSQK